MEFIVIGLLLFLTFIIVTLLLTQIEEKQNFNSKIKVLELLIVELNANLIEQNYKVKLSEDLKNKLKESNLKLSNSILDLNLNLFDELYLKNNN